MKKNILRLLALSALTASLALSGCTKEEPSEVTPPEDTAHVTENADVEDPDATEVTNESDGAEENVVYDPDKEALVFEEFKLSLFKGYSTIEAQNYLKNNIKYLGVEFADQAILELEKRQHENQNYYINQVMDEEIQNSILDGYNVEDHVFNIDDMKDGDHKTLVQTILDNGYKFFPEEGLFYPIVDYRQLQAYDKYTSNEIRSYLAIFARDSDAPTISDAHLNIMVEELSERIIMAEEHLQNFPEGQTFDKVYDAYEMYMQFYTVSMAYMGGFDIETRDISEELLGHYKTFVKENPESVSAAIIQEYLDKLEEHDNKINGDVQDFLQDINKVVVKHIASLTVK